MTLLGFVVQDNAVKRRVVTVGAKRPRDLQILSGVEEGEAVVVVSTGRLDDGTRVKITH